MTFWLLSAAKMSWGDDAQRREAVVGELDEDPFRLLADDVHLLDARHVQQSLAQRLRVADEARDAARPCAFSAYSAKVTSEYSSLTIGPMTPRGKLTRLVAELLARLIELLRDVDGRRAVAARSPW